MVIVTSSSCARSAHATNLLRRLVLDPDGKQHGSGLPAALVAADHDPTTLELVCLGARLATAARREGFRVIDA